MTRRRRAAALLGLALLLGTLAASDIARRERAIQRELGPLVQVVAVRAPLAAGDRITRAALAVRRVPARYAPLGALRDPGAALGRRVAVDVASGADLDPAFLGEPPAQRPVGPRLRPRERALDLVVVAAPDAVVPGVHVDVLVTEDGEATAGQRTHLALADAEVLATAPITAGNVGDGLALPRMSATLRVTVRQAVALTQAAASAQEVRLLPRPTRER